VKVKVGGIEYSARIKGSDLLSTIKNGVAKASSVPVANMGKVTHVRGSGDLPHSVFTDDKTSVATADIRSGELLIVATSTPKRPRSSRLIVRLPRRIASSVLRQIASSEDDEDSGSEED
jgi:hypothetical protein